MQVIYCVCVRLCVFRVFLCVPTPDVRHRTQLHVPQAGLGRPPAVVLRAVHVFLVRLGQDLAGLPDPGPDRVRVALPFLGGGGGGAQSVKRSRQP